jgi:superfamily I DNA and RNA helicase
MDEWKFHMTNSLFYNHITSTDLNHLLIEEIELYADDNPSAQLYLVRCLLGEGKNEYEYEEEVVVVLSPKHKILFINLGDDNDSFEEYCDDFIQDLNSISNRYKYQNHLGRPRKWRSDLTHKVESYDGLNFADLLKDNELPIDMYRKNELLISLITGSINDIEKVGVENPKTLLEKVKNSIMLFDGEQTRFIYKPLEQKKISIQGLSGTGKTELLMHKLKEIYSSEKETKIFFTCHNNVLADHLKQRIPNFFDFMKVDKQIQWNSQLWVDRAWGSQQNKNSGLYSYICNFYGLPFSRWSPQTTYEMIFSKALDEINKLENFKYAFDYILIDEKQDFPDVFFDLCEKIARKKVYVAGDIFQDIFENNIQQAVENVDYVLNKCYRTAPNILMFAHAVGMGLFEKTKLNWLEDAEWKASGYHIERSAGNVILSRDSVRRFDDIEEKQLMNMNLIQHVDQDQVVNIIKDIIQKNPTVKADDIAVIMLDRSNYIYNYVDLLQFKINSELGWDVNKSYETKRKVPNELFVSNVNNVKGLEFPFVICITKSIKSSYSYRNSLYTMLTRSFLQSYLLVNDIRNLNCQLDGLKNINEKNNILSIEPTAPEKAVIKRKIVKVKDEKNISFYDFMMQIFSDLKIDKPYRKKFIQAMPEDYKEDFDEVNIKEFIEDNRKYFCK